MMNDINIRLALRYYFPDLEVDSFMLLGEGTDNNAYLVNEELVFLFPRNITGKKKLQHTIRILPQIRHLLNLEVPDFKDIAGDFTCAGYLKIEGNSLTRENYTRLSKPQQENIQYTIAAFLTVLHELDLTDIDTTGLVAADYKTYYKGVIKEAEQLVFPVLSAPTREFVTNSFRQYLTSPANFRYKPVMLHNDLSADHILFDTSEEKITGIIDFGDISLGDPDYDLMYLMDDYGKDFMQTFLQYYPHPDPQRLINKLTFFCIAEIISDMNIAQKQQDQQVLAERMWDLQNWMAVTA